MFTWDNRMQCYYDTTANNAMPCYYHNPLSHQLDIKQTNLIRLVTL